MKDNSGPMIVVMVIVAIALFGGSQGAGTNGLFSTGAATPEQKQQDIQQQLNDTQSKVDQLKTQVADETAKKTNSQYKGLVTIYYINRGYSDPNQEYATIHVSSNATSTIPVTGWTLKSVASGASVKIPQASYLYFSGSI